ncbi:MAG: hypothetical protein AB1592_06085 [Pseudomonadota bacterium]
MQEAPARIELRVEHITQLLNTLDPYPFRERDLDPSAEAFILEWARDLPTHQALAVIVHVAGDRRDEAERDFPLALRHFFAARAEQRSRDLRQLFRVGRVSLAIGLGVLAICILLSELVAGRIGDRPFAQFLDESLIILGWVANWRPIEIFLYDWWPIVRERQVLRRLAAAHVEVRPTQARA